MGRKFKIINIDKLSQFEKSQNTGIRGEVITGKGLHYIPTIDPFGNTFMKAEFDEVIDTRPNIVPIGAYQFVFNKLFNIGLDTSSTLRVGDMNDELPQMSFGVPRAQYISTNYNAETSVGGSVPYTNSGINISAMNFLFGFMVGCGGNLEDNITAIAPDYKRRNLYKPIPFRMSNDGWDMAEGQYFGKKSTDGATPVDSYYIKKFDTPAPRIIHVWNDGSESEAETVDDSVFSSTSSVPIETYAELNISISASDVRGYFTSTNNTPRVNEFALVGGWYNAQYGDYESVRMFTHFTRPSIALSDGDGIEAIYRLYAR